MLKNITFRLLALSLVLTLCSANSIAQSRINFKRGRTSAVVTGKIGNNNSRQYVVRAKANQLIGIKVSAPNDAVTVSTRAHSPGVAIDYQLEQDGDVNIFVENSGSATKFTMTVTIR